jgi:hypothetical protein
MEQGIITRLLVNYDGGMMEAIANKAGQAPATDTVLMRGQQVGVFTEYVNTWNERIAARCGEVLSMIGVSTGNAERLAMAVAKDKRVLVVVDDLSNAKAGAQQSAIWKERLPQADVVSFAQYWHARADIRNANMESYDLLLIDLERDTYHRSLTAPCPGRPRCIVAHEIVRRAKEHKYSGIVIARAGT